MSPRTTMIFLLATVVGVAVGIWLGMMVADAVLD